MSFNPILKIFEIYSISKARFVLKKTLIQTEESYQFQSYKLAI